MHLEVNPVPFAGSTASSWKSGGGGGVVSDQFPAGLRVLVVDDDPTCLRILEKMLRNCLYEVTKCSRAEVALKLLRDNKDGFDVVISDVHMPDMDGFKLLEHIGLEMDLPVIMMSADDSKRVVMKGVTHGACDYLIKPVRMEALKNIWQHVIRRKKHEWGDHNEKDVEQSGSVEDGERQQKQLSENDDYSSSANEGSCKNSKKRKNEDEEGGERDEDSSSSKKQRVVWTTELHQQFVTAVNQLGIDKAVPKKILDLMNVQGLTRENVASHLQKYRLYLRRLSGQHHNGIGNSFMGPTDATFGQLTSVNGLDLQSLASSSSQLSPLGRSTNRTPVSVPLNDPRNIFSFESPNIRFVHGQQQQQHNGVNRGNLLHGIPTNMNMPIHPHSSQSNSLLTQMVQPPQQRNQIFNDGVFGQNGIDGFAPAYTSIPQPSSVVDFSRSQRTFSTPVNNNFGIAGLASSNKGMLPQHDIGSEINGFVPTCDVFTDVNQNNNRTDDWGFQSVGPTTFEAPQHLNVQSGGLVNNSNLVPQNIPSDSLSRIRGERLPDVGFQNSLFSDQDDDLLSTYIKQNHQDGSFDNEFGFDGYPLDDLPV
ncbi:hypothetical protein ABFS82_14G005900 [Erythranthe guttata]|uniref:two-component response regulator ARR2-like n=1 Tax=Erythranthe guttata TaxID=4155 RepID=UPI00064DDE74|nr:PREDICTED: two-component response regulator ARR2-like [Erythranthe guttata]|eukprot:XP_012840547.1 PREDICTED: two-component response regulator ARR2-like [Erythranthe guttata]